MPPVILWAAGLAGAAIIGRFLMRDARRVNAELHPDAAEEAPVRMLERDPKTGEFRPR